MSTRSSRNDDVETDRLHDSVARFEDRRRRWRAERRHGLSTAIAVAGLGWLIVIPAAIGFIVGHRLDVRFGAGVVYASALGLLGLVLGCSSAWSRIARHGATTNRESSDRPKMDDRNDERGARHA